MGGDAVVGWDNNCDECAQSAAAAGGFEFSLRPHPLFHNRFFLPKQNPPKYVFRY